MPNFWIAAQNRGEFPGIGTVLVLQLCKPISIWGGPNNSFTVLIHIRTYLAFRCKIRALNLHSGMAHLRVINTQGFKFKFELRLGHDQ